MVIMLSDGTRTLQIHTRKRINAAQPLREVDTRASLAQRQFAESQVLQMENHMVLYFDINIASEML